MPEDDPDCRACDEPERYDDHTCVPTKWPQQEQGAPPHGDRSEMWLFALFVVVLAAWGIDAWSVSVTGEDPLATGLLIGLDWLREATQWVMGGAPDG